MSAQRFDNPTTTYCLVTRPDRDGHPAESVWMWCHERKKWGTATRRDPQAQWHWGAQQPPAKFARQAQMARDMSPAEVWQRKEEFK